MNKNHECSIQSRERFSFRFCMNHIYTQVKCTLYYTIHVLQEHIPSGFSSHCVWLPDSTRTSLFINVVLLSLYPSGIQWNLIMYYCHYWNHAWCMVHCGLRGWTHIWNMISPPNIFVPILLHQPGTPVQGPNNTHCYKQSPYRIYLVRTSILLYIPPPPPELVVTFLL